MRKKTVYDEAPSSLGGAIAESRTVADFLPPPDRLVLREETEKITIALSRASLVFFKDKAKKQGVPYQLMIRKVLDLYSERFQDR